MSVVLMLFDNSPFANFGRRWKWAERRRMKWNCWTTDEFRMNRLRFLLPSNFVMLNPLGERFEKEDTAKSTPDDLIFLPQMAYKNLPTPDANFWYPANVDDKDDESGWENVRIDEWTQMILSQYSKSPTEFRAPRLNGKHFGNNEERTAGAVSPLSPKPKPKPPPPAKLPKPASIIERRHSSVLARFLLRLDSFWLQHSFCSSVFGPSSSLDKCFWPEPTIWPFLSTDCRSRFTAESKT